MTLARWKDVVFPEYAVPLLREALICAVDDPRSWGRRGAPSERYAEEPKMMNVIAEIAAMFCWRTDCPFCGAAQDVLPEEDVLRFNPAYPLCECFTPQRKMAFEYVPNWDTPEGHTLLLQRVKNGVMSETTPVYQTAQCAQCKNGPVVVRAGDVVKQLVKGDKHRRKTICLACHLVTFERAHTLDQARLPNRNKNSKRPAMIIARPLKGPPARVSTDIRGRPTAPLPATSSMNLSPVAASPGAPEAPLKQ